MKRYLLILIAVVSFFVAGKACAQGGYDGIPWDSTTITFANGLPPNVSPDTAASPLWQFGTTIKPFFDSGSIGMMTDTVNNYPVGANNYFTLKIDIAFNCIIDVWHKYQTDSAHDGGIIEFSNDVGVTWENILGTCNGDSFSYSPAIHTENVYSKIDTLITGESAFTGTSTNQQYSRIQFFAGLPLKGTDFPSCSFSSPLYLRFRFVSDSTVDSLAGWKIDSIKIENDQYLGAVVQIKGQSLNIVPNPSYNGIFTFPDLANEEQYTMHIVNALGQTILDMPYNTELNMGCYPHGLYFYKVTDGERYYSGRLLIQ